MQRSIGAIFATCAVLALPASAAANTKTVFAGPPPTTQKLAGKVLGKSFVQTYNPDVNDFFLHRVTINAGDSVSFIQAGFHTIDLPGKSGQDLPLILAGSTKVSGVNDAAGSPFWFNGVVPNLNLNPALFARSKSTVYNGSTRLESGLPPNSGKPKPFTVKFTKAGVYKYFCDIHLGMVGFVVVKPKGKTVPTAKQDAAALSAQITARSQYGQEPRQDEGGRGQREPRRGRAGRRRAVHDVPIDADGQDGNDGDVLDLEEFP